jgi:hypothetical protein
MRFGDWRSRSIPPRRTRRFNRRVEFLPHPVEPFLLGRDLSRLFFQFGQVFFSRGQQHISQAGFIDRRIRDAHIVPHQLGDDKIRLE